jgi:Secretion system C-terminal sorting domain/Ig-like domain CHU_C associated
MTICAPTTATLNATVATGTVNWYANAVGGSPLASTAAYTTPALNATTTYYAENEIAGPLQHLGATGTTIGTGNFYTAATYHYLRFSATSAFKLLSVLVNANTTANRTIELRNSAGTVLQSAVINIPAGLSRISLNFNVPIGTNMQLGVAGNNSLYRNSAGATFPYTINNIVSITGNSANNTVAYYYFYDWEITKPCLSARVPVVVTVNQNTVTPSITQAGNVLTSSAATGNQWYNSATGIIAGATNNTYTATISGTYYVVQTDANGCVSNSSNAVNIVITNTDNQASIIRSLAVYPNPTNGVFQVDLSSFDVSSKTIGLYNLLGEEVFTQKTTEKVAQITVQNLPKGAYLIKVFAQNMTQIGAGRVTVQ